MLSTWILKPDNLLVLNIGWNVVLAISFFSNGDGWRGWFFLACAQVNLAIWRMA